MDAAYTTAIQKSIRKRKDAIAQFEAAQRQDLVDQERAELAIVQQYVPAVVAMSDDQLEAECRALVAHVQATTIKDMRKVLAGLKEGAVPALVGVPSEEVVAVVRRLLSR